MDKLPEIAGIPLNSMDKLVPKYCTHAAVRGLSNGQLLITLLFVEPKATPQVASQIPPSPVIETIAIDRDHAEKLIETIKNHLDKMAEKKNK